MQKSCFVDETTELKPDDTELTSVFIQGQEIYNQDIIRNRLCHIYITHMRFYMGLLGPLPQGNAEIGQLLFGSVLKATEFHKNTSQ